MSETRAFLRHTLATLAYRGGKALRGVSPGFASYGGPENSRTPARILSHVGDLLDWTLALMKGEAVWKSSEPLAWDEEVARFHAALERVDAHLASGAPVAASEERLFQGPIADALTHVGQIAMLRRLAGEPMKGENYYVAQIEAGRVGPDQAPPRREF
jgi:hypothetical protein